MNVFWVESICGKEEQTRACATRCPNTEDGTLLRNGKRDKRINRVELAEMSTPHEDL